MSKFIDLTGQEFYRWTVIERAENNRHGQSMWWCKCECGTIREVASNGLLNGTSKSCGCLKKDISVQLYTTHGESNTVLYGVWHGIKQRCSNPKHKHYENYGGRGIKIEYEPWETDYAEFSSWAKDNGYKKGLTLERLDNNKGYSPDNCIWATRKIQNRNQRVRKDNNTGIRGVSWDKDIKMFSVSLNCNNKLMYLDHFNTIEEAAEARKQAELKYWNERSH